MLRLGRYSYLPLYGPRKYKHPTIKDAWKSGPFLYLYIMTKFTPRSYCPQPLLPIKRVAILVDGGFYKWRAHSLFGEKNPQERADELFSYCFAHTSQNKHYVSDIYRIFYYDCEPSSEIVYNPISKEHINLKQSPIYKWSSEFISLLKQKRKVALRLGKLTIHSPYSLSHNKIKQLCNGTIEWKEIGPHDLTLNLEQKGVDMRIGIDIASLAFKHQVDQIVLISGDSDFVPAAKLARREGIDFIVDSMGAKIADDLFEHIDGLQTRIKKFLPKQTKICPSNQE